MHPLIQFNDVTDMLTQANPSIFSVLDMVSGHWEIPLELDTKQHIGI